MIRASEVFSRKGIFRMQYKQYAGLCRRAVPINHVGDIDVYNGEICAGVECVMGGEAKNNLIAAYDAKTLEMARR